MYCLTVLEARYLKSWFFLKAVREGFVLSPGFWWPWELRDLSMLFSLRLHLIFPLYVSGFVSKFALLIRHIALSVISLKYIYV